MWGFGVPHSVFFNVITVCWGCTGSFLGEIQTKWIFYNKIYILWDKEEGFLPYFLPSVSLFYLCQLYVIFILFPSIFYLNFITKLNIFLLFPPTKLLTLRSVGYFLIFHQIAIKLLPLVHYFFWFFFSCSNFTDQHPACLNICWLIFGL